jgi:hypothetical protein
MAVTVQRFPPGRRQGSAQPLAAGAASLIEEKASSELKKD